MAGIQQADWQLELTLTSAAQTLELADRLKDGFTAGDVVLLSGPIGAGKSLFARALIQGLLADHGLVEDIPSPTFTLVQTYQAGGLEIWHSDLYRLTSADEVAELGLFDAFSDALCLIEWPDRLGDEVPANSLAVSFEIPENADHRVLTVSASQGRFDWVRACLKSLPATTEA